MTTTTAGRRLETDDPQDDQELPNAHRRSIDALVDTPALAVGDRLDLGSFQVQAGECYVLPPIVVRRLEDASEIDGWARQGLFTGPSFAGEYKQKVLSVLSWAYWLGWSESNLEQLGLLLEAHRSGRTVEGLTDREVRFYSGLSELAKAEWLVDGGEGFHAPSEPAEIRPPSSPRLSSEQAGEMLRWMLDNVEAIRFEGRTAHTDRIVLRAVLNLAAGLTWPTIEVRISVRDLAKRAGFDPSTIRAALGRLEGAGFLRTLEKGRGNQASRYLIRWPASKNSHKVVCSLEEDKALCVGSRIDAGHPAASRLCLGQPGFRLASVLRTATEPISDVAWRSQADVERRPFLETYLRRLTGDLGVVLAVETEAGWVAVEDFDEKLDLIVETSGAGAKIRRRTERLEREQRNFGIFHASRIARIDLEGLEVIGTNKAVDTSTGEIVRLRNVERPHTSACVACGVPTREHVGDLFWHEVCPGAAARIRVDEVDAVELPRCLGTFGPADELELAVA